jgi:hypothetical protein
MLENIFASRLVVPSGPDGTRAAQRQDLTGKRKKPVANLFAAGFVF